MVIPSFTNTIISSVQQIKLPRGDRIIILGGSFDRYVLLHRYKTFAEKNRRNNATDGTRLSGAYGIRVIRADPYDKA